MVETNLKYLQHPKTRLYLLAGYTWKTTNQREAIQDRTNKRQNLNTMWECQHHTSLLRVCDIKGLYTRNNATIEVHMWEHRHKGSWKLIARRAQGKVSRQLVWAILTAAISHISEARNEALWKHNTLLKYFSKHTTLLILFKSRTITFQILQLCFLNFFNISP